MKKKLFYTLSMIAFVGAIALNWLGLIDLDTLLGLDFEGFAAFAAGVTTTGSLVQGTATVQKANDVNADESTQTEEQVSENYLDIDYNKKIVLIAPNDSPIDTITREIGNTRKTTSIETGGWEIGVRDVEDTLAAEISASDTYNNVNVTVSKPAMWKQGDTFRVIDGENVTYYYVNSKTGDTLNCVQYDLQSGNATAKESGLAIQRLSVAMPELAAQTKALYQTPVTRTNYCQIHMAQVEESVIHSLHKKQVVFDFATMKEQTIWQMKRDMEMANLFGKKAMFPTAEGDVIYTSDGLFNQIEHEWDGPAVGEAYSTSDWVAFTKEVFDGNNGSERRIAIIGPDLMEQWSNVDALQKQMLPNNVEVLFGVRFNRIITNFGELLVKCASGLFLGAYSNQGLVIDPAYIRRDVYEPLNATSLNLDETGQRRVKALRLIENYCLFVENQPVHCIIKPGN